MIAKGVSIISNSNFIGAVKKKIIKEFIKDDAIVQAIHAVDIPSPEKLVGTHIFNYHENPNTINKVMTFITIQVHIPINNRWANKTYIQPRIEIWIISHKNHMVVDNVPKITSNRNDYLASLIDKKLNGRSDFGIDKLTLKGNTEGCYQQDYVYRTLVFEGLDLNNTLCDEDSQEW